MKKHMTIRRIGLALAVTAALSAGLAAQAPVQEPVTPPANTPAPAPAARAAVGGKAALQKVHAEAEKLRGTKGPERLQLLETFAQRFEQVASEHAGDRLVAAEAWFEAAELWRRHNSLAKADVGYRKANELDAPRYAERALLELGHVQRRQKEIDAAIANYRTVAALKPTSARSHEARLWIGRTLQTKGDLAAAITAFEAAVTGATTPTRVVEACDYLAKALIRKGDLDGARAAIQRAESKIPTDDDPETARITKAVEGMSARRALQRALDGKTDPVRDAEEIEEGGGDEPVKTPPDPKGTPPKR
jgi:tetratricopeptide (TPR) repeat protein